MVVVDPRPYMTYQPFLPEVVSGSIEARHAAVSLRRNLRRTQHRRRLGDRDRARPAEGHGPPDRRGPTSSSTYDIIVVTAGAVTRTFAIPGVAERAIGMKHVEEAVAIRDRLLTAFDQASVPRGPVRSGNAC